MSIRNVILGGAVLAVAAVSQLAAQDNKAEIYGGYVYAKVNPLSPLPKQTANGWVGSMTGYATSWFGFGGEISAVFGDVGKEVSGGLPIHAKQYSYLFGPQFRFVDTAKVQTGVKILLGGAFAQARLASATTTTQVQSLSAAGYTNFDQTKFAALFAVPIDISVSKLVAFRVEPGLYMTDFNHTKQSNFRLSVGPVFRFGAK